MALPSALPISMSQVATELGVALPLNLLNSEVRKLTGIPSGAIKFSNLFNCLKGVINASGDGTNVGYIRSVFGSYSGVDSENSYRGAEIYAMYDGPVSGKFFFRLFGNLSQSYFRGINMNGVQYLSVNAITFTYNGTYTEWSWTGLSGMVAGNPATYYIG